jgi:hypothetical protein
VSTGAVDLGDEDEHIGVISSDAVWIIRHFHIHPHPFITS